MVSAGAGGGAEGGCLWGLASLECEAPSRCTAFVAAGFVFVPVDFGSDPGGAVGGGFGERLPAAGEPLLRVPCGDPGGWSTLELCFPGTELDWDGGVPVIMDAKELSALSALSGLATPQAGFDEEAMLTQTQAGFNK